MGRLAPVGILLLFLLIRCGRAYPVNGSDNITHLYIVPRIQKPAPICTADDDWKPRGTLFFNLDCDLVLNSFHRWIVIQQRADIVTFYDRATQTQSRSGEIGLPLSWTVGM